MIADDVVPIPIELWNWGISHCSGALRSFPEDKIKLALMPTDTATVTVKGIKYRNVYYVCERAAKEFWFEKAKTKSWKIDISYDPRNMSMIYVRNADGSAEPCWLSNWQEKYVGKSLDEIMFLHEAEKAARHKNAPREMTSKAELSSVIEDVISEAEEMARQTVVPKAKSERTKNIRNNRSSEKTANRLDEVFSLSAVESETPTTLKAQEGSDTPVSPILEMIRQQLEERLNDK
jgi:hypothetical protein